MYSMYMLCMVLTIWTFTLVKISSYFIYNFSFNNLNTTLVVPLFNNYLTGEIFLTNDIHPGYFCHNYLNIELKRSSLIYNKCTAIWLCIYYFILERFNIFNSFKGDKWWDRRGNISLVQILSALWRLKWNKYCCNRSKKLKLHSRN